MIQQTATILWNRPMGADCRHMALSVERPLIQAVPGQFVMVQAGGSPSLLLRRPFSIAGAADDPVHGPIIELLIKVVGSGTRLLADMRAGEPLDLIGPLGHGFRIHPSDGRIFLAAGGIGVAPIRFLAHHLITSRGVDPGSCHLFLGGRSQADLLCREDFQALGIGITVTTDDGSDGNQCLITDPLESAVADTAPDRLYVCGPHGMLVCVAGIVERFRVACQVSIETRMACGLGVCLGCAVASRRQTDSYLHACIHGPVFDAAEIELDPA